MYLKNKEYPLTVRFSKEEIDYLKGTAKEAKITPSKFLRMVVNVAMRSEEAAVRAAQDVLKGNKEG